MGNFTILEPTSTLGAGPERYPEGTANRSFQVTGGTTNGTGAAVVQIQVSNDGIEWLPTDNTSNTVTLALSTTDTSDGFVMDASWHAVRARLISISGTGAGVSVMMGTAG